MNLNKYLLSILFLFFIATFFYAATPIKTKIDSDPSGVTFTVNDDDGTYTTPMERRFREGEKYKLTFFKDGYKTKTLNYTGGDGNINIKLEKKEDSGEPIKAKVNSNPSGASVSINDGDEVYTTPFEKRFRRGVNYELTFTKDGYQKLIMNYTGGNGDINVNLEKKEAEKIKTNINSNPSGADVEISGMDDVFTTPFTLKLRKGVTYELKFTLDGYQKLIMNYTGGNGDLNVNLQKKEAEKIKTNINSNPSGASVEISGMDDVFTTPFTLKLRKGVTYELKFTLDGYQKLIMNYTGGNGDINVNLQKKEAEKIKTNINSNPSGASVEISGMDEVFTTPFTLKLRKGVTYELKFTLDGYQKLIMNYTGGNGDLNVNLQKKEAEKIMTSISTNPAGASVEISGKDEIFTTPVSTKLRVGVSYEITFTKEGYETKTINYIGGNGNISINLQKIEVKKDKEIKTSISTTPSGAKVEIRGINKTYNTPCKVKLIKGEKYKITISLPGFKTVKLNHKGGDGNIDILLLPFFF